MHLTRHTDYALRVLMYLAHQPDRLATIAVIAEAYGISRNHLMKVVHELGKAGFVRTMRGKQGGLQLGHPAAEIGVGSVVRAMEGNLQIIDCNTPGCPIVPICSLRDALDEARDAFLEVLDGYSLEDLVHDREKRFSDLLKTGDGNRARTPGPKK